MKLPSSDHRIVSEDRQCFKEVRETYLFTEMKGRWSLNTQMVTLHRIFFKLYRLVVGLTRLAPFALLGLEVALLLAPPDGMVTSLVVPELTSFFKATIDKDTYCT